MAQQFHTIHLYNSTLIVKTSFFFEIFSFILLNREGSLCFFMFLIAILPQFFSGILLNISRTILREIFFFFEKSSSNVECIACVKK